MAKKKKQFWRNYQLEIANDQSKFKIINKSRQIGVSELMAYLAVKRCVKYNIDVFYMSALKWQASHWMQKVEKWVKALNLVSDNNELKMTNMSGSMIRFAHNGNVIRAITSSEKASVSMAGDLIFDETARHKNFEDVYKAAFPAVSNNDQDYRVTIVSTPLGQSNFFYELYNNEIKYPGFKRFSIDVNRAINDGFNVDLESIKSVYGDETTDEFRENFLCEFIDETTAVFPHDLLERCSITYNADAFSGDIIPGLLDEYYIGIDVGMSNDLSVITTIGRKDNKFYVVDCNALPQQRGADGGFPYLDSQIELAFNTYKPKKMFIDQGFNPETTKKLETKYYCAKGISFGGNMKPRMVDNLKILMQSNRFYMSNAPELDLLRLDLHTIQRKATQNGVNYTSPRNDKGHGDRAWSLMLAALCAEEKKSNFIWV